MNYEQAINWCHANGVVAEFYDTHVELTYGSGYYTSSGDFLSAVTELQISLEGDK